MAIETIRSLKEKHQALALRGEPVVLCEDIARQLRRDGMPTAALGADRCATVLNQAAPISGERVREAQLVCIGELIEIDDGMQTKFVEWNDDRYKLEAGAKVYAALQRK